MSDSESSKPASAEEFLPPVEPPSVGFILQLFVVPAAIVLVIVGVWLSFNWLIRASKPEDLIQGLQGGGVARWQRASELADVLRSNRYPGFKTSPQAASQLAGILEREIDTAQSGSGMDESAVTLRFFLCRALGEFQVDAGLPVLVKAATTDRDPREEFVRRGAIQAIAVLIHNLRQFDPPQEVKSTEFEVKLIILWQDDADLIRSEAAYALGVLGTEGAVEQLEELVEDPYADTRYNAALALARQGNVDALPVLAEMLDPAEMASVGQEKEEPARYFKRSLIMANALAAIQQLAANTPGAAFSSVIPALQTLAEADEDEMQRVGVTRAVIVEAQRTLRMVEGRRQGDKERGRQGDTEMTNLE
ncbi:MAG: HEAT repeat domain-containing protein [Pirellulaceae bacterium]